MATELEYSLLKYVAYLVTEKDKIIHSGELLWKLSEYDSQDIDGNYLSYVLAEVFKIHPISGTGKEKGDSNYFLFTKNFKVREVSIHRQDINNNKTLIIFNEKTGSRLEEKQSYLEHLSRSNVIGVAVYSSLDLILLKANKKFLGYLSPPFNEIQNCIGKSMASTVREWPYFQIKDMLQQVFETGKSATIYEYTHNNYKNNVEYCDITFTPVYENSKLKYLVINVMDVTERVLQRKHAENQSRIITYQKDQLEAILENMSDGLFIADKSRNIVMMNASMRSFHYQPDSLINLGDGFINHKYFDLSGKELTVEDLPAYRTLKGETIKNMRMLIKRPDKDVVLEINSSPLYDEYGIPCYSIICSRDITQQLESETLIQSQKEQLLQAERDKNEILQRAIEMKDEFLSLISHEFKTPITVINSAIQAMEFICKDELSEKSRSFLSKIKQNSLRQLRLVNNLLDYSRVNSGHVRINMQNHNIVLNTKAIVDSVRLYAYQKALKIEFECSYSEIIIGLDEEKYERILLNLLSNAIKFSSENKKIRVFLSKRNGFIRIEVCDEGIGIPKDKLKIIFERFGQVDSSLSRQAEGTGIGLSLVKLLVESMEGSISVKSVVGKGSTFILMLPDRKVTASVEETRLIQNSDSRLIQATAVEFSDIYLN